MLFTGQLSCSARLFLEGSEKYLLNIQKFEKYLEVTTKADVHLQELVRS